MGEMSLVVLERFPRHSWKNDDRGLRREGPGLKPFVIAGFSQG